MRGWSALILAAGRGPDDPMAKAYGVLHKCALPVNGLPMLQRVATTLKNSTDVSSIAISIDDEVIARDLIPAPDIIILRSENSAPSSALAAIRNQLTYPVLITTADHPLLTPEMVQYFCNEALRNGADISVGLATAETILTSYPEAKRTFFKLGHDRVSGCNLFAVTTPKGLKLLERWQYLEQVRKKPWRLVAAFGPLALARFLIGRLSLNDAFAYISQRLQLTARPILLPFAEAAIDVDKPSDFEQAQAILQKREQGAKQGS